MKDGILCKFFFKLTKIPFQNFVSENAKAYIWLHSKEEIKYTEDLIVGKEMENDPEIPPDANGHKPIKFTHNPPISLSFLSGIISLQTTYMFLSFFFQI